MSNIFFCSVFIAIHICLMIEPVNIFSSLPPTFGGPIDGPEIYYPHCYSEHGIREAINLKDDIFWPATCHLTGDTMFPSIYAEF